jgi:hypothetical protein
MSCGSRWVAQRRSVKRGDRSAIESAARSHDHTILPFWKRGLNGEPRVASIGLVGARVPPSNIAFLGTGEADINARIIQAYVE